MAVKNTASAISVFGSRMSIRTSESNEVNVHDMFRVGKVLLLSFGRRELSVPFADTEARD